MPESRVDLAGIVIDLFDEDSALAHILDRATHPPMESGHSIPVSVVSANLDHLAQFGRGSRWEGTLGDSLHPTVTGRGRMEWLTLLDGAPLVNRANRLTGRTWPRLAGSDLIGPLLDGAAAAGLSVGFLGGSPAVQQTLSRELPLTRPSLTIAGLWSPDRSTLIDPVASRDLARAIRVASPDILVVGLGKPRQELWMAQYGALTGARVLLAFGAVVDFLAGSVQRAPRWVAENGLEWAWRLALEPRRLARRYLVDDPPSLLRIQRDATLIPSSARPNQPPQIRTDLLPSGGPGTFVGPDEEADIAACIVSYNSGSSLEALFASLRAEACSVRLTVVVADNDSTDGTVDVALRHPDVRLVQTGGNLGYAAALNMAMRAAGRARSYLILNADLELRPGAAAALLQRLAVSRAGIAVPKLVDEDGAILHSLRREPSPIATLGDALLGDTVPNRPALLSETEHNPEAYQHAHRVDWATGAALLIDADLAAEVGEWDERFFLYSEEADFFRRARLAGAHAWYEPSAVIVHTGAGSGSSPDLDALLAVNRVRYARKHQLGERRIRAALTLREALRVARPGSRRALRELVDEARWTDLPGPTPGRDNPEAVPGSIIIPAHNEASVIATTLSHLEPIASAVEVIVACNGCTDETPVIARRFEGVRVLELETPSKTAALNAGDAAATLWPRLYLDADIEIPPVAVRILFERLSRGDILAARPSFRWDDAGATWPVRAFYRAKRRIPTTPPALWGAGAYAVSKEGRERFGAFPALTADDLFVDLQFDGFEKLVVTTPPVRVRTPQTTASLLAVLRRTYRGQAEIRRSPELVPHTPGPTAGTARGLLAGVWGPSSLVDAVVCAALIARARLSARRAVSTWERDESTRPMAQSLRGDPAPRGSDAALSTQPSPDPVPSPRPGPDGPSTYSVPAGAPATDTAQTDAGKLRRTARP